MTKKGDSTYKKYWIQLKQNPNILIKYDIEPRKQTRFIRMVQKLKWLDNKYKQKFPGARLVAYRRETYLKLMLITSKSKAL